jgi:PAS domain S-box-containing protein
MVKNNKKLLEEREKLDKENAVLRQQLRTAKIYIDAITSGNVDAFVIPDKKDLKVYAEKTSDKSYRILIEKMHEGAVTVNDSGIILYCNTSFAEMVKLPLQKVIGTKFENFIDDASKKQIEILLRQESLNVLKEEGLVYASDSKEIPVLITVNTLSLDNSFVLSIILTDLTVLNENKEKIKLRTNQVKQKNMELLSANKELAIQIDETEKREVELSIANTDVKDLTGLNRHKERIIATLSHDLRSPLAGIIQTLELLKDSFETLEYGEVKEMLDLIYNSSIDELNLLDYLVEWARIKYAADIFSPVNIELSEYVNKVFNTLNENAVANKIELHNEIQKDIIVFADGKMLLSIIQNIVSNAIKHTPEGGRITVNAKRKEDTVITEIEDTGAGMSKELKEKLFNPQLFTLSSARKENKGAGIGLLLVKAFVDKNGGEVWVESAEGSGSTFYFKLPAEKPNYSVNDHMSNQNQIDSNQTKANLFLL